VQHHVLPRAEPEAEHVLLLQLVVALGLDALSVLEEDEEKWFFETIYIFIVMKCLSFS